MIHDTRGSKRKSTRMNSAFAAALCLSSLLIVGSQSAQSDSGKQIISVRISHDPIRRAEDLKDLSQFDILGVSLQQGIAEVGLLPRDMNKLKALGFQIEFSPLNAQLNREALEPYLTPSEVLDKLSSLSQTYPAITSLKTIGFTRRKRPIQAIIISSEPNDTNRPTILLNAMHHAREVMTTEVVMHAAEVLLRGFGNDQEITHWLETARIIVVPQVNPDGNQLVHEGQTMWRKNAWESDGRTYGVDINRNYPTLWGACNGSSTGKFADNYRGPSAASEPETNAMMSLVQAEKPVANISYHSFSEMILYPYGCRSEKNPSLELFKSIGADIKANLEDDSGRKNTYELGTPPELLYEADGTDADWQFREAGVVSFAMEINSRMQGFQPSHQRWRDITVKRQESAWKTLIRRTLEQGVRGRFVNQQATEISYRIVQMRSNSLEDFTGEDKTVKPFRPRSSAGLLFNTLLPGDYAINISLGNSPAKTVNFSVKKGEVTDLGDISL